MSTEIEDENSICCHKCAEGKTIHGIPVAFARLIVCRQCGNKRCPHASDHDQPCTGSNEPGQADAAFKMCDQGEDPSDVLRMIEHGLRKANRGDA